MSAGAPPETPRGLQTAARHQNAIGWLALAVAIAAAAAAVFHLQRGLTWGWDEFFWLENSGLTWGSDFLHPYGGHLIVSSYLTFKAVIELFGVSFTAFSIVQVIGLSLSAVLIYVYARRRVGPILALAPAVVILFLGSAWAPLLEPLIGIQFLTAIVPGLAALVAVERRQLTWDIAACILLCLALAGFSEGAVFLVGAATSIALSPSWRRRAWIVVIPAVLYGGWRIWASQFESTGIITSNIPLLPSYFSDAFAVFAHAAFGLVPLVGMGPWSKIRLEGYDLNLLSQGVVFVVVEVLVILAAVRFMQVRRGGIPRTLWPAVAMVLALWVELGLIFVSGRTANESRYLYLGVLLLLLVLVEVLRGVRLTWKTAAVALALTVAAVFGNLARFHEGRAYLDLIGHRERADMTVIELAGADADPWFIPDVDAVYIVPPPLTLNVGPWQLLSQRYGSSGFPIDELRGQGEGIRNEADLLAIKLMDLRLTAASGPLLGCRTVSAAAAASGTTRLPRGGGTIASDADTEVWVRRWAQETPSPIGSLTGGQPGRLRIPPDSASAGDPWYLGAGGGPIRVCRLG